MKVGIVTTWFERGGAYVSRQYMKSLQQRFSVHIYARGGEARAIGDPSWDGPHVTWAKPTKLPVIGAIDIPDLKAWVMKNALDVVFFNEQQWWEPVAVCNEMGVRTGSYVDYYTERTIPFFRLYDFLICNTKRHYSAFSDHPASYYVPWGTETDIFAPTNCERVREGCTTFFHSCGYSPGRKGTDLALKALALLDRQDCRLIIHSQVRLGERLADDAELLRRLVAAGRVEVVERTVGAPGLYRLGDVYLAPSRLEGLGLPLAEAISSGLPVIATNSPPMSEFVTPESGRTARVARCYARRDGYYWPQTAADPAHIAERMAEYADMGAALAAAKRAARTYAEQHLNWADRNAAVCEIFENCASAPTFVKPAFAAQARLYDAIQGDLRLAMARKLPVIYGLFDAALRARRVVRRTLFGV